MFARSLQSVVCGVALIGWPALRLALHFGLLQVHCVELSITVLLKLNRVTSCYMPQALWHGCLQRALAGRNKDGQGVVFTMSKRAQSYLGLEFR